MAFLFYTIIASSFCKATNQLTCRGFCGHFGTAFLCLDMLDSQKMLRRRRNSFAAAHQSWGRFWRKSAPPKNDTCQVGAQIVCAVWWCNSATPLLFLFSKFSLPSFAHFLSLLLVKTTTWLFFGRLKKRPQYWRDLQKYDLFFVV